MFTPRCPGAQAVAGTEPRCVVGTVSSSPPSETILTLISRAKEVGTGTRPKSGSWSVAESSLPAVQPGSRAFFPEHCHLLLPGRGCRQDEGRAWSQGPSGDRVLFFVFLLGPHGVRVRVPWGLALRRTSVGCLQGHPLEIWGVKETGLDQKWGGG